MKKIKKIFIKVVEDIEDDKFLIHYFIFCVITMIFHALLLIMN